MKNVNPAISACVWETPEVQHDEEADISIYAFLGWYLFVFEHML